MTEIAGQRADPLQLPPGIAYERDGTLHLVVGKDKWRDLMTDRAMSLRVVRALSFLRLGPNVQRGCPIEEKDKFLFVINYGPGARTVYHVTAPMVLVHLMALGKSSRIAPSEISLCEGDCDTDDMQPVLQSAISVVAIFGHSDAMGSRPRI